MSTQAQSPHRQDPFDHRTEHGQSLHVRELAEMLRNSSPADVDQWVLDNVTDLDTTRQLLGTILKYLVARGL